MTTTHDPGHQATQAALADGVIDDAARAHLNRCQRCQTWSTTLRTVLTAAPSLFADASLDDAEHTDRIVAAVIRSSSQRPRRPRVAALSTAAALLVVVAGTVVWARSHDDHRPDPLTSMASQFQNQDSVRFVFEVTADVKVPVPDTDVTLQPLSLRQLPVCTDTPETTSTVDINDLLNAALQQDPCAALAQIRDEIGDDVAHTAQQLATTKYSAQQQSASLTRLTETGPELQRFSAKTLLTELDALIGTIEQRLQALVAAQDATIRDLTPLASAASNNQSVTPYITDATDGIIALKAAINAAPEMTNLPPATVKWDSLATGTWTQNNVTISGTATSGGDTPVQFENTADDPLGLAQILLGDPDTLLDILRSAPQSGEPTVQWTVPANVVAGAGLGTYTATATSHDAQLQTLILTADTANGTTVTVTLTPAH